MTSSPRRVPAVENLIEFPAQPQPVASIIILAWRLTSTLIDCLQSLRDSVAAPAFEVQLVLNGASNATREIVATQVRGAHIVDLDANVGFGGGCNAAALRSRGTYLVLLNDDTVVQPDWLASLVRAATAAPKTVGAIASVLLNQDGSVQEAGSRVLNGAGTLQFGRGMSAEAASSAGFLTKRPIDYGSGAALLLRRSAFEAVGGFDPLFEPAYYEDVDLCFRLRAAGWDVLLEPSARVVHASGGSTDRDRRFRDFAADRSGSRFIERWSGVLASAPEASAPLRQLCDPRSLGARVDGAPTDIHDPIPSIGTALAIAEGYQRWLNQKLDVAEEAFIHERHLRSTDRDRIVELTDDVARLRNRLSGLEAAGPWAIMRWRLGILRRRWHSRREIGVIARR